MSDKEVDECPHAGGEVGVASEHGAHRLDIAGIEFFQQRHEPPFRNFSLDIKTASYHARSES